MRKSFDPDRPRSVTIIHQASFPCPKCHSPCTHIERVVVSQGYYTTIIDSENDRLIPHSKPPDRSGSVIDTYLWCENGHSFISSMEFIEGGVIITIDLQDDHDGDMDELWHGEK